MNNKTNKVKQLKEVERLLNIAKLQQNDDLVDKYHTERLLLLQELLEWVECFVQVKAYDVVVATPDGVFVRDDYLCCVASPFSFLIMEYLCELTDIREFTDKGFLIVFSFEGTQVNDSGIKVIVDTSRPIGWMRKSEEV